MSVKWERRGHLCLHFPLSFAGLLIRVQAGAVPGVCGLLHVRPAQGAAQPVSAAHQAVRRLHLPAKLDRGQTGAAQPHAIHDLPQQGRVGMQHFVAVCVCVCGLLCIGICVVCFIY